MPEAGLEPALPCGKGILSPLRLPVPPLRRGLRILLRPRSFVNSAGYRIWHSQEDACPGELKAGRDDLLREALALGVRGSPPG